MSVERPGGSLGDNARTVESYEQYAATYVDAVRSEPAEPGAEALRRLAGIAGPGGHVLELGSGPGWDADYAERFGVVVRRTDVTRAFCDFQSARGRSCTRLDALRDAFGGPYDGVMALCVVQHFGRDLVGPFVERVAAALRPGGGFLVSVREGDGAGWETGDSGRDYVTVMWTREPFVALLAGAGLAPVWQVRTEESEGAWLTMLARKMDGGDGRDGPGYAGPVDSGGGGCD